MNHPQKTHRRHTITPIAAIILGVLFATATTTHAADTATEKLTGAQISALLSNAQAVYDDGAWQSFAADGSTIYQSSGREERGTWRVNGDQYCSRWGGGISPGAGAESCYDMTRKGKKVRWNGQYPAKIIPGDA